MLQTLATKFYLYRSTLCFIASILLLFGFGTSHGKDTSALYFPPLVSTQSTSHTALVEKGYHKKGKKKSFKRKVLFIVPHLVVGGLDRAFIDMLRLLPQQPSDYHVCILSRGGAFECFLPPATKIVTLKHAKKFSYDTVVSYAQWIDPTLWVNKIRAKKYVQWLHADLATIGGKLPLHKAKGRKGIDVFVGVSKAASQSLVDLDPKKLKDKTITIQNCINENDIVQRSLSDQNEIVRYKNQPNVVTVARLSVEKGIERLIRVHSKLNKEGIKFRWYYVGSGYLQERLEKLVHEEGLDKQVFFLGHKMNPYPYIKAADLFVLGSYSESWGIVITEAMILHRPVLSTIVAGSIEQINSGVNGLLVENDEDSIYKGLKQLILHKEIRDQFTEALSDFHYDNSPILNQLQTLLFTTTNNKKKHHKKHRHAHKKTLPSHPGMVQQLTIDEFGVAS